MSLFSNHIPLSLYVHLPWCVQKCPYCDFNSHAIRDTLPEDLYVSALLQELDSRLFLIKNRPIISIFLGGGTPSLFSALAMARLIDGIAQRVSLTSHLEITLEANPGTAEQARFRDFRLAGINRLSLGVQSLQDDKLHSLGRIHNSQHAIQAVSMAKKAGFTNLNLDIMYGLPDQHLKGALYDVRTALSLEPSHFSWYQLTIEPNTLFYRQTPVLPTDEHIWDMQMVGQDLLKQAGFQQYEISAYSKPDKNCLHNRNYWEFGDYLGIGAGAHSKLTDTQTGKLIRFSQVRHPKDYLNPAKRNRFEPKQITENDLVFEFMLNALRLTDGVSASLFIQRTGLSLEHIQPVLTQARQKGLLIDSPERICPSAHGKNFLNDLTMLFLDQHKNWPQ